MFYLKTFFSRFYNSLDKRFPEPLSDYPYLYYKEEYYCSPVYQGKIKMFTWVVPTNPVSSTYYINKVFYEHVNCPTHTKAREYFNEIS